MLKNRGQLAVWGWCGVVVALCGCHSLPGGAKQTAAKASPVVVERLEVDGQTITAIKLLAEDGRPYAFVFRAAGGLVVCPHFDLNGLEKGGMPAARAQNWKQHGFREQLDEAVDGVNRLAVAKGITKGMTVRQALGCLGKIKGKSTQAWTSALVPGEPPASTPSVGCGCSATRRQPNNP